MQEITQELIKEIFDYDANIGRLIWKKPTCSKIKARQTCSVALLIMVIPL